MRFNEIVKQGVDNTAPILAFIQSYTKRLQGNNANRQKLTLAAEVEKTLQRLIDKLKHILANPITDLEAEKNEAQNIITEASLLYEKIHALFMDGCKDYAMVQAIIYVENIRIAVKKLVFNSSEEFEIKPLFFEEALFTKLKQIQSNVKQVQKEFDLKKQVKCVSLFTDINKFFIEMAKLYHFGNLRQKNTDIPYLEYYQIKLMMQNVIKITNDILSNIRIIFNEENQDLNAVNAFMQNGIVEINKKIVEKTEDFLAREFKDISAEMFDDDPKQLDILKSKMNHVTRIESSILSAQDLDEEKIKEQFKKVCERIQKKIDELENKQRQKIEKALLAKAEIAKKDKEKRQRSTEKPKPEAIGKQDEKAKMIESAIDNYLQPRKTILETPAFKNDAMNKFNKLITDLESLKKRDDIHSEKWKMACEVIRFNYPGWNLVNLMNSLLETKPVIKTNHILAKHCQIQISNLDKLGINLLKQKNTTDRAYGLITRDLAADLANCLNHFFASEDNLHDPQKQKAFQKSFNRILHSQDSVMQVHRAKLKKCLSNIAIGLALTLSLLGMPMYALVTGKNPFSFFYQHKTAREDQIDLIAEAMPVFSPKTTSAA